MNYNTKANIEQREKDEAVKSLLSGKKDLDKESGGASTEET